MENTKLGHFFSLSDESKLVDSNINGEIRVSSNPLSINACLLEKLDSCAQLGNNPDHGYEMQKETLHSNKCKNLLDEHVTLLQ